MQRMKHLLSVSEVAARFEVTSQTVRNWITDGRLRAIQPARRGRYRITQEALQALEHDAMRRDRATMSEPPIDVRSSRRGVGLRDPVLEGELDHVVAAIVAAVQPQAVYLFGSRSRGDWKPDSDFDLAVIVPDGSQRRRVAMTSYDSLVAVRGRSVGVDVAVLTPQLIRAERDLVGSIAGAVVREGVLVFGQPVV